MGRTFLNIGLFFVAVFLSVTNQGGGAESRHPIPSPAQQLAAQKLIDEVYIDPEADTLIRDAINTRDDPAATYMLLRMAGSLAAAAGDLKRAMYTADQLSNAYDVDGLEIKVEQLELISKKTRDRAIYPLLVEESLALIDQALSQNRFELAKKLSNVALKAARKTKAKAVIRNCVEKKKSVAKR
ncbi:MAG: hypothetical protein QF408_08115, partial [Pirellulales bacterium]|nr:hypothetical protein [Pirellulales bacterium]